MEKNIINDSLNWILARGNSGGKHSLEKIKRLLEKFDNPQDKLKVIHVAGTNGKGSVSNYLAKTISKKYSCGLFTSPYMERINEAVSISGQEISDSDFCKYIEKLKKPVEDLDKEGFHNTYFEVLTALMYLYFYEKNVDYAVVEVGLGGSLDSTNIIKKPIACVISTISYDHTNILGDTLEEIAGNKAGIIKNGSNVFVYPQKEEAMKVIEEKIEKENAKLHKFDYSEVEIISLNDSYNEFSFRNFKNVKTNLLGKHQVYNASLALMVLDFFKDQLNLTDDLIKEAIFESKNPGRLQFISKKPRVLIDGSHNKEAIDALILSLKSFKYKKLILGFSILKDKDYTYIIKKLAKISDEIVVTEIDNPRALNIEEIKNEFKKNGKNVFAISDRKEAYEYSKGLAKENDLIIWCGSLYLIGDLMKLEEK